MFGWKTIYSGPNAKIQQQIITIFTREKIPYKCGSIGFSAKLEGERYYVKVRTDDHALAVLILRKYKKK